MHLSLKISLILQNHKSSSIDITRIRIRESKSEEMLNLCLAPLKNSLVQTNDRSNHNLSILVFISCFYYSFKFTYTFGIATNNLKSFQNPSINPYSINILSNKPLSKITFVCKRTIEIKPSELIYIFGGLQIKLTCNLLIKWVSFWQNKFLNVNRYWTIKFEILKNLLT